MIYEVNANKLMEHIQNNPNENIVVIFSASWCKPCHRLKSKIKMTKPWETVNSSWFILDAENKENNKLMDYLNISALPTIICLNDGMMWRGYSFNIISKINNHLLNLQSCTPKPLYTPFISRVMSNMKESCMLCDAEVKEGNVLCAEHAEKRLKVQTKSIEIGHCVCTRPPPKGYTCPCPPFVKWNICHCAGEDKSVNTPKGFNFKEGI